MSGSSSDLVTPIDSSSPVDRIDRTFEFSYRGHGLELGLIMMKNVLLTILTFGIYQFWSRVRVRKYVWSQTEIDGFRLQYTGNGMELFIGALKVVGLYLCFLFTGNLLQWIGGGFVVLIWSIATIVAFWAAFALIILFAFRYRLTRTMYRGVRLSAQTDNLKDVVELGIVGGFLSAITLGFFYPVYMNNLHKELLTRSRYGSLKFNYTGPNRKAFVIWIKMIVLAPLTLGLYFPFYRAELLRFRAKHTTIGDAVGGGGLVQFENAISGVDLLKIYLLAFVAVPVTLGIATPWVLTYSHRVRLSRMKAQGTIDFEKVAQSTSGTEDALGESLTQALDFNLDFG